VVIEYVLLSILVISCISMPLSMLDYLYALSLLSITITLFYLTKSCFAFKGEIPHQGEEITNRIEKVHGVLDEMMDFIAEIIPQGSPTSPQTPPDILSLLSMFLKPSTPSPINHGETQEERSVYEIDENKTQTESELS